MAKAKTAKPVAAPPLSTLSWWVVISLLAAAIAIYAGGITHPLIFDDFGSIGRNESISDLRDLGRVMSPPAGTPVAGRPFANFTLAVNYAIHGLDVRGYHAGNIALHLVCALLIYGLLRRTLARPEIPPPLATHRDAIAWSVALIWTVHPLNSEVVNYLTQRTEATMAACYLLALYASVRALDSRRPGRWQIAAIAVCAAGMASKETMVTAPLAIALYDRVFAYPSWVSAWRSRRRLYIGLASSWLILAVVVLINGQTMAAGFAAAPTSPWLYFVNQMPVLARYLRLAFWPHPLVLYYGWPLPLTLADVWPAALLVFSLAGIVIWTLIRRPRIGYLGAWMILTLAPASSVVPVGTEVAAERRMYLPLAGLIALIVLAVVWAVARARANRPAQPPARPPASPSRIGVGVTVAIAIALGAATIARTRDYASSIRMAELDVERWPTPQSHQVFGVELAAAGRHSEAIDHLRRAADAYPGARYFLGAELLTSGQLDAAIVELQRFVQAEPNLPVVPGARVMMARAFEARTRVPEAIEQLKLALTAAPARADAHGQLANLLAGTQQFAEAIPHYRAFLDASPRNAEAWTGLAIAQISSGNPAEAVASFKSAVDANPRSAQYRFNYARALLDQGNVADARAQLERALQLDPTFVPASEMLRRLPR
ncbi:MAG TPA: tetratricopeptide repeat protein [Vicinamibacterales bacterium]|nr:tetratricopeptide repeat protein [Vicinamibacterales bacterium]